jgi:nitroreductase
MHNETSLTALPATEVIAETAATLIASRRTILPKRLTLPAPDEDAMAQIFAAAAAAPDHGQLLPWRFVLIPVSERHRLGQVFVDALLERDSTASDLELNRAREKAERAPVLMLAVVDALCGDPAIDLSERLVSAGCAIQNMLLMATALGFGSALTSGKALKSTALRSLFNLSKSEHAVCFISLGSVGSIKRTSTRPEVNAFVTTLPLA